MIKRLLHFLTDGIFRLREEEVHSRLLRWALRQYKLIYYTARGVIEHDTLTRSASLTFYTLMAIVPLAAIIFAVMKGFGMAENLTRELHNALPQFPEFINYIVGFANNALARTRGGLLATFSVLALFWAVMQVFSSIEAAFNNHRARIEIPQTGDESPLLLYGALMAAACYDDSEVWDKFERFRPPILRLYRCGCDSSRVMGVVERRRSLPPPMARNQRLDVLSHLVKCGVARADLDNVHLRLHRAAEHQSAIHKRPDRRPRERYVVPAVPMGVRLSAIGNELIQCDLR